MSQLKSFKAESYDDQDGNRFEKRNDGILSVANRN